MYFAIVSVVVYLIGTIPYLVGIYKGDVLPHIFSYLVWGILIGINLFVLSSNSGGWAILPAIVHSIGALIIIYGSIGVMQKISINWFDYLCLGGALLSLAALIWVSKEVAVILTVIIDFIAFLPTFRKCYSLPYSEYMLAWLPSGIFPFFLILSLHNTEPINMIFYAYSGGICFIFIAFLWVRRRYITTPKTV